MLIAKHRKLLNDGLLSPVEALIKFKGKTDAGLKQFKLPDQEQLTKVDPRLGKVFKWTEFVKKVEELTKYKVWMEESIYYEGGVNFYTIRNGKKKCCMAAFRKDGLKQFNPNLDGCLPQFTIIKEGKRGLPEDRIPGWTEVLYRLIVAKVTTLKEVDKVFPRILEHPSASRWFNLTRIFR